jgi:hypothetical protein
MAIKNVSSSCFHANIDKYYTQYVVQTGNPWGWVEPGESYTPAGVALGAPWQQDFVSAAVGFSLALDLTTDATRKAHWASFFNWKAQSTVKRLGPSSGFWYINGDVYSQYVTGNVITENDYRNGTGVFYTEAEAYAAEPAALTATSSSTAWLGTTDGILNGEIMPGERALWGNIFPSLSYAVRFGVPGALTSYTRVTSASNFAALQTAFNGNPVWSVKPASGTVATPAWLSGAPVKQWVQIANTSGANGSTIDAFSGFTVTTAGKIIIPAAGGHGDSSDNRVSIIDLMAGAPSWSTGITASPSVQINVPHYLDGTPSSRHLYTNGFYVPSMDKIFLVGCQYAYGGGFNFLNVDAYNVTANTWDGANTHAPIPLDEGSGGVVFDGTAIWTNNLRRYVPTTDTWTNPITTRASITPNQPWAYDSRRSQLFGMCWGTGGGGGTGLTASRVPIAGTTEISVTINASSAFTQWLSDKPQYAAMGYDPDNDLFYFYTGQTYNSGAVVSDVPGRVYVITPNNGNAWDMSIATITGTPPTNGLAGGSGINGRFRYVPALKGFVQLSQRTANLNFFKVV